MPEPILSDGEIIETRTLGIFDLDNVPKDFLGPFTYQMKLLGGDVKEAEYDISRYEETGTEPPEMPDVPESEIVEESNEWYQMRDAQRYQAAELHGIRRLERVAAYADNAVAYILREGVVNQADIKRIVTEEDWELVYVSILIPQLSKKILADALSFTFDATYDEQSIFEAMDQVAGGHASYNAVRQWEIDWSNEFGVNDAELAALTIAERARRVAGFMLPKWVEALESNRIYKGAKVGPDEVSNQAS